MLGAALRLLLWRLLHVFYSWWLFFARIWDAYSASRLTPKNFKGPRHVALLVGETPHSYPDLARLLLWSLAADVQYFTFYDRSGLLKRNENKLYDAVEKFKINVPGQIYWSNKPNINGYKNGTNHKITVNIFSVDDGKQKIVSLVKDMCSENKVTKFDPKSVDVEYVDRRISELYPNMPVPNLAIYCGELCCADGFLPWHIRLTEFLSLGSHREVKLEKYVQLLQTYATCEQRFGK